MLRKPAGLGFSAAARLPDADDDAKEAVLDSLDAIRDALPQSGATFSDRFLVLAERLDIPVHGEALAMSIPMVETCLDHDPSKVGAELLAQLAFFALLPALPEQIALQVAFGWGIADEHVRDFAPLLAHRSAWGLPNDNYLAALDAAGGAPDTRVARCFRGEEQRDPDRSRVTRGIAVFRRAAAHAPEGMRPPLLCVVAWLFWAVGKRPHALAHLAAASRIEPGGALVHALTEHLVANMPCWIPVATRDQHLRSRGADAEQRSAI